VRISLIVRGICGLRPGIVGLSENIRVKSIVGRLPGAFAHRVLRERPRPSRTASAGVHVSADWMGRNMDRRVETLFEAMNPTVKAQIVDQVMAANLADVAQSWVMLPDGSFARPRGAGGRLLVPRLLHGEPVPVGPRVKRRGGRARLGPGEAPEIDRGAARATS
jgi:polyphosphate kinase